MTHRLYPSVCLILALFVAIVVLLGVIPSSVHGTFAAGPARADSRTIGALAIPRLQIGRRIRTHSSNTRWNIPLRQHLPCSYSSCPSTSRRSGFP